MSGAGGGMPRVVIIGGGPAGMMAAITAASHGADVTLLERNEKLGKKLYITGKGRCNVTNACGAEEFFERVVRNPGFMRGAYSRFDNHALMDYLGGRGVPTVIERGSRVFPQSGKASDVTRALDRHMRELGVTVRLGVRAEGLIALDGAVTGVKTADEVISCDGCVVATGGLSYPVTGSTGDGYRFAEALGIGVTPRSPSLTGIRVKESWPGTLAGLTLKNVELSASVGGKRVFRDKGEALFTHEGLSGPLALSLSAHLAGRSLEEATISIDLKPALDYNVLSERLQRDMAAVPKKAALRALDALTPRSLAEVIVGLAGINPQKRIAEISSAERAALVKLLKALPLTPIAPGGWDEAVITRGGVEVKSVSPVTMASKDVRGLYFAGEVLDVDALTGGFNLQIAFSTGYVAGMNAAQGGSV